MRDEDTLPIHEYSDSTDSNSITDFTQITSCALGNSRQERRQQRIRAQLVRDYIRQDEKTSRRRGCFMQRLFKLG